MPRLLPLLLALFVIAGCDGAAPLTQAPPACVVAGGAWEFLGLQAPDLSTVGAVATSPHVPGRLLAATLADFSGGLPGQLFLSDDDGQTWQLVHGSGTFGGGYRAVAFDFADPAVAYALPYGVIKSEDGGQAWTPFGEGLPELYAGGSVVQNSATGTLFFIGGYTGGGLWRREPGEPSWAEVTTPVEGLDVYSALHVGADGWLYVGGDGLWRVDLRTLTATEPGPCDP